MWIPDRVSVVCRACRTAPVSYHPSRHNIVSHLTLLYQTSPIFLPYLTPPYPIMPLPFIMLRSPIDLPICPTLLNFPTLPYPSLPSNTTLLFVTILSRGCSATASQPQKLLSYLHIYSAVIEPQKCLHKKGRAILLLSHIDIYIPYFANYNYKVKRTLRENVFGEVVLINRRDKV